jgi:CheY-like chemotaxis protein
MTAIAERRILVLEDEFLIAMDLVDLLEDLGAEIVGPAHRNEQALELLANSHIDAAVLDVNINGQRSDVVAQELRRHSIPFIFATGYGDETLLDGATVIRKPYRQPELERALKGAMKG